MLISATEMIRKSIALYRENGSAFLRYMALLLIPWAAVSIVPAIMLIAQPESKGVSIAVIILVFIVLFLGFWFALTFFRVVAARYEGKTLQSMASELHASRGLFWSAIWVSILSGLAVFGGVLLFIIPGIIFGLWFYFSLYAVVIDNARGVAALKMSHNLVKGRWWSVLWRIFAPAVLFGIISALGQWIIMLPMNYLYPYISSEVVALVSSFLVVVWSLFLSPITMALPIILYTELKKTPLPAAPMPVPQA